MRIVAGPARTVAVGFDDGFLGIWDSASGALLQHRELNGAVRHLRPIGHRIAAATELGDVEMVDLAILSREYCDLMDEVWAEVSTVWERGHVEAQQPPTDHACAREGASQ